ncbi:RHS repeat-associated core domain-containing protein [Dyella sp. ASV21]|uniref:RHS repeat-associated core domain-containing protein n=1 Tax=Dyella sp. ASV21 TaxID=2795114 RepID=UPI0018EC53FF|nr:RHS repeat-associated core domain-containing protein [Dyella sp. ASV21]
MLAALAKPRRSKGSHCRRRTGESRVWLPGQYYDVESGLADNGARSFEAATGRFPQPDPSGISGGLGLYVYGLNNPLLYFDPDGQQATNGQQGAFAIPGTAPTGPMSPGVRPMPITDPVAGPRVRIPSPTNVLTGVAAYCGSNPLTAATCVIAGCVIPRSTADSCADEPATPQLMQRCSGNNSDCDKEGEDAINMCEKLISQPDTPRGVTGGYRNIMQCAKGLVSQRCGGNRVN